MARKISVSEAMAALAAVEGFKLTDAQKTKIEATARNEYREAATTVFERKVCATTDGESSEVEISMWVNDSFTLASRMAAGIVSEERAARGRGIGTHTVHAFQIETPEGRLTCELS